MSDLFFLCIQAENLRLVDFNDLFVIAVGVSMAYIVLSRHRMEKPFQTLIFRITNRVRKRLYNRKLDRLFDVVPVIFQIKFYLKTGKLKEETKGVFNLLDEKASEIVSKMNNIDKWIERKQDSHTKMNFFHVISFDCFVLGILALFVGAMNMRKGFDYSNLMEWAVLLTFVELVHCLIYERLELNTSFKSLTRPNVFLHTVLMGVLIILTCFIFKNNLIEDRFDILEIIAVITCFIGFIAYFIYNFFANLVIYLVSISKMKKLKIKDKITDITRDIERYKKELDAIDNDFKNDTFKNEISIE